MNSRRWPHCSEWRATPRSSSRPRCGPRCATPPAPSWLRTNSIVWVDVTTRLATPEDLAALVALWSAAARARLNGLGLRALAEDADRVAIGRLGSDQGFAVLTENDGEPVAVAAALPARQGDGTLPERIPGLLHVSMVAVHPDYWGQR